MPVGPSWNKTYPKQKLSTEQAAYIRAALSRPARKTRSDAGKKRK